MEVIYQGAEAIIYREDDKIIKDRIPKRYRIKELDEEIRFGRTKREANLLREARRIGVNVPRVLEVEKSKIVMEFIEGKKLKYVIDEIDEKEIEEISREIGEIIGKLHSNKIVHGDLTTSNFIYKEGKIYLIDFGLGFFSERIEDYSTDLLVLKESIIAAHNKYINLIWDNILKGYSENFDRFREVLERMEKIEQRGRYVKR